MTGEPDSRANGDPSGASSDEVASFVAVAASDNELLERRYRRWLRIYPPGYRQAREDEMVAVLMDSAAPGQLHPSSSERWDLLRGALRARRAVAARPATAAWIDIVAAAAVVLPVVFAVQALIELASMVLFGLVSAVPADHLGGVRFAALRFAGWAVVSTCLLTRRDRAAGRWAALTSVAVTTVIITEAVTRAPRGVWTRDLVMMGPHVVLLAMVSGALLSRPLPARGRALLGRRLIMVAGGALAASTCTALDLHAMFDTDTLGSPWTQLALLLAAATVMGMVTAITLAARRGATALVALVALSAVALAEPVAFALDAGQHGTSKASALIQIIVFVAIPLIAACLSKPLARRTTTRV